MPTGADRAATVALSPLLRLALAHIATSLAEQAGARGITAADIRTGAAEASITVPDRAWLALPAIIRQAGLVPVVCAHCGMAQRRKSPIPRSNENDHIVWRLPPETGE